MQYGLTPQESKLLNVISDHLDKNNGVSPSFDEMAFQVGLRSKSGVHRLVNSLESKGHIKRLCHRARSIVLVSKGDPSDAKFCHHCGGKLNEHQL